MAESKACDKGDYFPFTQETRQNVVPLPGPETEATPLTSKPLRSLTPRVQRFSKLSDAYFNITSRQGSTNTVRKASGQSQSSTSTATSDLVAAAPFPVASPRLVKSQDDLQISGSALAMPCSVKRTRRASFGSVDVFEGLSPNMSRNDLSLSKEIESELLSLQVKSQDTTDSTIEGILAQYDVRTSSLEREHEYTREVWLSARYPVSDDGAYNTLVSCQCRFIHLSASAGLASGISAYKLPVCLWCASDGMRFPLSGFEHYRLATSSRRGGTS